jgi:hypothetical protein
MHTVFYLAPGNGGNVFDITLRSTNHKENEINISLISNELVLTVVGTAGARQERLSLVNFNMDEFLKTSFSLSLTDMGFIANLSVGGNAGEEEDVKKEVIIFPADFGGDGIIKSSMVWGAPRIGLIPADSEIAPSITDYSSNQHAAIISDLAFY